MIWWRVEIDKDGSIKTCDQVEARSKGTNSVLFLQNNTKAGACSDAKVWYERYCAQRRVHGAKWRRGRIAAGLCRMKKPGCQQTAREGKQTCAHCSALDSSRRKLSASGALPIRAKLTPEQARANLKASERRSMERKTGAMGGKGAYVYLSMLRRFDREGPEAFRAWLVSKIPALNKAEPAQQAAE